MENKKEMRQWLNDFGLDHPLVIGGPVAQKQKSRF
jgi:chorismate mutase